MTHARRYFILGIYMLAGCTALSQPGIHVSLAQQYDQWCAVKVRGTSEWRFVPNPKQQGIKTASAYAEGLYYRHADATMLILCMRKQGTLAESAQYHVSNLAQDYASFNTLGNNNVQFQQAPAIWFLYNGVRKDMQQHPQHGYILISDRGQYSLVIALSANADAQHRYSHRPFDLASTSFSSGRSHHTRCDHDHTNERAGLASLRVVLGSLLVTFQGAQTPA